MSDRPDDDVERARGEGPEPARCVYREGSGFGCFGDRAPRRAVEAVKRAEGGDPQGPARVGEVPDGAGFVVGEDPYGLGRP